MLLATLFGWAIDWHLGHGFSASWFDTEDGTRRRFARSRESVSKFENYRRPLGRIVGKWDFDQAGVPKQFPDLDVELRTKIELPAPGRLEVDTPNQAQTWVDGASYDGSSRLAQGAHRLKIQWTAESYPQKATHWDRPNPVSLKLIWHHGIHRREVPRAWLDAPPAWSTRLALWGVVFGICVLIVWWSRRLAAPALLFRTALVGLFALAAVCRLVGYDIAPDFKDNDDELFATWNGWSLLSEGRTRGWTLWPRRYGRGVEMDKTPYFRKRPFYVVSPYVEHPPGLHVLAGLAAKLGGAQHWLHARLSHVRLVPIALSLLSLCLLFLLARELSLGRTGTLIAGAWFATTPHMVLQQRVVKEEALVTPMLLLVVLFALRYARTRRAREIWISAAIAGLAIMVKLPAVALASVVMAFALAYDGPKRAMIALAVSAGFASSILLYAVAIDWDLFWRVQHVQATIRKPHWNVFIGFFIEPKINHDYVGAGWQIFSWLALASLGTSAQRKTQLALFVPVIAYLVVIAIPSGSWHYGWYALPLYPFLSLGVGYALGRGLREAHPLWTSLFTFLVLFYSATFFLPDASLEDPGRWPSIRLMVSAVTALILLPAFWNWLRPGPYLRPLCQAMLAGIFLVHMALATEICLDYENRIDDFANLDLQSSRDKPIPGPHGKR